MTAVVDSPTVTATVTVTARQPLALGTAPQTGQLRDSAAVVSGSVLRGALAARWIRRWGIPAAGHERRGEFVRLFESGAVRFGPLFPGGDRPRWLSLLDHKYGRDGCVATEVDLASGISRPAACSDCGKALEPARPGLREAEPLLADRTHAALDGDERAADGQLFTRRRVRRGIVFTGPMVGPADAVARLLDDDQPLLLGGNRAASGRVELSWHPGPALIPAGVGGVRLVLRLTSPAVFVDGWGRPVDRPDLIQLSELLGVTVAGISDWWVRTGQIGGWHAASRLPKPTELAVVAGSVYVLTCAQPPPSQGLARLVAEGVGLRRHEGFGWLTVDEGTPR